MLYMKIVPIEQPNICDIMLQFIDGKKLVSFAPVFIILQLGLGYPHTPLIFEIDAYLLK